MGSHRADHGLQVIPALAADADLVAQDLRGDLVLGVADEGGDLFGNGRFEALLDLDHHAGMAQRRHIRLPAVHILQAAQALGEFAHDNLIQRRDFELVLGGKLDFIFLEDDLRLGTFEIEAIGQFFFGLVHGVLDFH
jgi:hypothetical protein